MDKESQYFEGILITGGPGSGKTTLLNQLASKGFTVHNEVARRIIKEQMALQSSAVPWDDIYAFSELAKNKMLEEFPNQTMQQGLHFFDRGIPDLIGYMHLAKKTVPKVFYAALEQLNYSSRAFILPPWEKIYTADTERKETFQEAVKVYHSLRDTYLELGFSLVEIPFGTVNERLEKIVGKR